MDKKILICTGIFPPQIGGPATYVLKMAEKISKNSIANAIITYSDQKDNEKYGLDVYRVDWTFFILTYLKYFFKVLAIGKKFDIIFLQGSFLEGIPTIFANFFLKKKVIIRIGGIYSWEASFNRKWTTDFADDFLKNKQKFLPEMFKRIDRFVISKCNKIIANSHYIKKLLILNKVDPMKIEVVYNPVDSPHFEKISKNEYKEKLGISDKKVLLYVGRFVPWKNLARLIGFFQELSSEYALVFAGDGPEKEKLMKLAEKNLKQKIIFLGKLEKSELNKAYQIADIFVLISSFEGLSHVLIEAMKFNLPIISSNIEPNTEALEDYGNCRIIDINKAEFLSAVNFLKTTDLKSSKQMDKFEFENIYKKTMEILCE